MKIESIELVCDESCVHYYSNSLLDKAFPLYDVNQWFSKCGTGSTIVVVRLPLVVHSGMAKYIYIYIFKQYILMESLFE